MKRQLFTAALYLLLLTSLVQTIQESNLHNQEGLAGGFSKRNIADEDRLSVNRLVKRLSAGSNPIVKDILNPDNTSTKLVYYSTQVVAGQNHAIVFEINHSRFVCLKIYAHFAGKKFQILKSGKGKKLEEMFNKCDFPKI